MKVVFYINKRAPVVDFILEQPLPEQAKIDACIKGITDHGLEKSRAELRHISGKLWEIKIRGEDSAYRIFYVCLKKDVMVLLHAYKKKSQKAPTKEIVIALRRMKEVLEDESVYI